MQHMLGLHDNMLISRSDLQDLDRSLGETTEIEFSQLISPAHWGACLLLSATLAVIIALLWHSISLYCRSALVNNF